MKPKKHFLSRAVSLLLVLLTLLSVALLPAGATEPEINSKQLADSLLSEIAKRSHPYILYSTEDIPALKEKITSGYSKKAFDYVKKTASGYLNKSITVGGGSSGVIGRELQSCVAYLCVYGELSEDGASYINKAKQLVLSAASNGSANIYHLINDALCVADFGYAYALAYDWLYPYLSDSERQTIRTEMEEIGTYLYENSSKVNTWGSSEEHRKAWNWNAVTHGALGMIALSLGDHADWLELAIDRTVAYYSYAVDATGAAMEGLHYIGYGLNTLSVFDYVVNDLTGVGLMDAYPAMQAVPTFSMNMTAPYGKDQAAINQGDELGNYAATFYIINRYKQEEALWGWEQTYGLSGRGTFASDYAGNGWNAPAIIFYEDKTLTPKKPTDTEGLNVTSYEKGLITARENWESTSSMITFTCGYGYAGCWNHPDDNSFTFYANGEPFIIDLGANYKTSAEHNVLQIDGVGMDYEGGPTMVKGTLEENKILETGALYLRGNNTNSYAKKAALTDSRRQLIYAGGETPFVLIYDYATKGDNTEHTYKTPFYTELKSYVRVSRDGSYVSIHGPNRKNICYMFAYSDGGVKLINQSDSKVESITTESKGIDHAQATLFITANPDGTMPTVEWSSANGILTATISRIYGGNYVKETYVLTNTELKSVNREILAPYEQETVEPTTEPVIEPDTAVEETTATDDGQSGGCGSAQPIFVILPLSVFACILATKRRKNAGRIRF
ncbi:MAG: heparinase II/III family protein [Clostridia bacterium]|nr:heparinase II/III family protein [Clostridia bacterium]